MRNKRFIAGATCPRCQQVDKIFTYEDDQDKWRACANCDFVEAFGASSVAATQTPTELPTRVNQNRSGEQTLAHETPYEPVKLIDPEND